MLDGRSGRPFGLQEVVVKVDDGIEDARLYSELVQFVQVIPFFGKYDRDEFFLLVFHDDRLVRGRFCLSTFRCRCGFGGSFGRFRGGLLCGLFRTHSLFGRRVLFCLGTRILLIFVLRFFGFCGLFFCRGVRRETTLFSLYGAPFLYSFCAPVLFAIPKRGRVKMV